MLKFNTIDTCSGGFGFQKQEMEKKIESCILKL